MLYKALAFLLFAALSPIGDAVNGYIKHPEGSCWPVAVISSHRMAFICRGGVVMVATVSEYETPRFARAACINEALNGLRAMMELKWVLYTAGDIRTTGSYRVGNRLYANILIDLDTVEQKLSTRMPSLADPAEQSNWCQA